MKKLFKTNLGLKLILSLMILTVDMYSFVNTSAGEPGKRNKFINCLPPR